MLLQCTFEANNQLKQFADERTIGGHQLLLLPARHFQTAVKEVNKSRTIPNIVLSINSVQMLDNSKLL